MGHPPPKPSEQPTHAVMLLCRYLDDDITIEQYEALVGQHLAAGTLDAQIPRRPPTKVFLDGSGVMHRPVMRDPTKR